MRDIAGAIVLAALILAAAIVFTRSDAPRYQMTDSDRRLDTQTGEIVACSRDGCVTIVPPGGI